MYSMAVISDEELIAYGHCSLNAILWFAECNHRERFMERMDPAAEGYFIKRQFRQAHNEEEESVMIEAQGPTQEDNQIRKRYMLRHKKRDFSEALGLPPLDGPLNIEQQTNPNMETKKTGKDINALLNMTLDEFFTDYNHGYSVAKKALKCHHIRTVRDLCYLSMKDLIMISGHPRTDLYDIQDSLIDAGLDLDMKTDDVIALKNGETIGGHDFYSDTRCSIDGFYLNAMRDYGNEEEAASLKVHNRMHEVHEIERKRLESLSKRVI